MRRRHRHRGRRSCAESAPSPPPLPPRMPVLRRLVRCWDYPPGSGRLSHRRTTTGHATATRTSSTGSCLAVRPSGDAIRPGSGRYSHRRT